MLYIGNIYISFYDASSANLMISARNFNLQYNIFIRVCMLCF